jgi:hypothetical protein
VAASAFSPRNLLDWEKIARHINALQVVLNLK